MKTSRVNVIGQSFCSLVLSESVFWCVGKQRTLSEPGVSDRWGAVDRWDRAQPTVAGAPLLPVVVSLTFSGSRETFPVSWLFFFYKFICLFIYGCIGSSLLPAGFL